MEMDHTVRKAILWSRWLFVLDHSKSNKQLKLFEDFAATFHWTVASQNKAASGSINTTLKSLLSNDFLSISTIIQTIQSLILGHQAEESLLLNYSLLLIFFSL